MQTSIFATILNINFRYYEMVLLKTWVLIYWSKENFDCMWLRWVLPHATCGGWTGRHFGAIQESCSLLIKNYS